jgi:glycine/D-amino acid oxidase-like deaminating enzyme
MGFAKSPENWINAVMHVGVTLAPVAGYLTAELIDKGETSIDIDDFSANRF